MKRILILGVAALVLAVLAPSIGTQGVSGRLLRRHRHPPPTPPTRRIPPTPLSRRIPPTPLSRPIPPTPLSRLIPPTPLSRLIRLIRPSSRTRRTTTAATRAHARAPRACA